MVKLFEMLHWCSQPTYALPAAARRLERYQVSISTGYTRPTSPIKRPPTPTSLTVALLHRIPMRPCRLGTLRATDAAEHLDQFGILGTLTRVPDLLKRLAVKVGALLLLVLAGRVLAQAVRMRRELGHGCVGHPGLKPIFLLHRIVAGRWEPS